jgi:hypothetical protein
MENDFEVQDANGVIHSGTRDEMFDAFYCMTHSYKEVKEQFNLRIIKEAEEKKEQWQTGWSGDLKLVEIHNRYK